MRKPVQGFPPASALAKGATPRARAISTALNLPGPAQRAKQAKELKRAHQKAYEDTLPKPALGWLDELTN